MFTVFNHKKTRLIETLHNIAGSSVSQIDPAAASDTSKKTFGGKRSRTVDDDGDDANRERESSASASTTNNPNIRSSQVVAQLTADKIISKQLQELSIEEREKITYGIHGVNRVEEESSELIQRSLQELNQQLNDYQALTDTMNPYGDDEMDQSNNFNPFLQGPSNRNGNSMQGNNNNPNSKNAGLYIALRDSPHYVRSNKFLIMFLRREKFDVIKSLERLQLFFELKRDLFGPDCLGRDITLQQDMEPDDIALIASGYAQILPGRDRAGRAILLCLQHLRNGRNLKSIVRNSISSPL